MMLIIGELQEKGIKCNHHVIWPLINPMLDTPIDLLHTLYLGLVKHLIIDCIGSLNSAQKPILNQFINSFTTIKGSLFYLHRKCGSLSQKFSSERI